MRTIELKVSKREFEILTSCLIIHTGPGSRMTANESQEFVTLGNKINRAWELADHRETLINALNAEYHGWDSLEAFLERHGEHGSTYFAMIEANEAPGEEIPEFILEHEHYTIEDAQAHKEQLESTLEYVRRGGLG